MLLYNIIPRKRNNGLRVRRLFDEPFELMGNRMGRFFDDFFECFGTELEAFSPRMDVAENEKEFSVALELPGVSGKDVHLSLEKDCLIVEGEKKETHEEKEKGYSHIERSYGSFRRVIPLYAEIDANKAKATFKKGVLTIKLPKSVKGRETIRKIALENN
jgi:HSP20 family protein